MRLTHQSLLCLACILLQMPLHAQLLRNPPSAVGAAPEKLPPYRAVRPQPTAELNATIKRMQGLIKELQQADLSPEQKQVDLDELIKDHNYMLRQHDTWLDWRQPQTVDSATLLLEKMIFQEAADLAPTEQSREQVLENAPQHLELAPDEQQTAKTYEPPLAAPVAAPVDTEKTQEQNQATASDEPVAAAVEATTDLSAAATNETIAKPKTVEIAKRSRPLP